MINEQIKRNILYTYATMDRLFLKFLAPEGIRNNVHFPNVNHPVQQILDQISNSCLLSKHVSYYKKFHSNLYVFYFSFIATYEIIVLNNSISIKDF